MLVCFADVFKSINFRIEDIPVQRETVLSLVGIGWDGSTESKNGDLFVLVVVLEDSTDGPDRIQILILRQVDKIMKRICSARVTIRLGKIDGNGKGDLTPTHDIFEEGMALCDVQAAELQLELRSFSVGLYNIELFLTFFELGIVEVGLTTVGVLA